MKPNKAIWVLATIMFSALLMASIIGCKEKKANVKRPTSTSSEDYSEQTNESWYEGDEQEPNDEPEDPDEEPNMHEEDPNDEPNLPEDEPNVPEKPNDWPEEPNEFPEEPNEEW